jgi:hypothetical protein
MKLIFIFILYFNLNVVLTAKTSLGINFDPKGLEAPVINRTLDKIKPNIDPQAEIRTFNKLRSCLPV